MNYADFYKTFPDLYHAEKFLSKILKGGVANFELGLRI